MLIQTMKKIVSIYIMICLCTMLSAQTIRYTYDAAGNRTERYIDMTPEVRSAKAAATEGDAAAPEELEDRSLSNAIRIYPNPTEGLLKVEIDNLQENQKASIALMTLQGQTVLRKSNVQGMTELDISNSLQGTYIMRISIDGNNTEWKIIKK